MGGGAAMTYAAGMRVALGQLPVSPDPAVTLGRVREALTDAAARGADLMVFPEATLEGIDGFKGWYRDVTHKFFDEIHTVKEVDSKNHGDHADVKVVVNWQAKVWNPPDAKSKWLGFDAYQTWKVARAESGDAVIREYVVDELRPMEGSATL